MYEQNIGEKQNLLRRFRSFIIKCIRVLRITKKPTTYEFKTVAKISALGMAVIGLIGFLITWIKVILGF